MPKAEDITIITEITHMIMVMITNTCTITVTRLTVEAQITNTNTITSTAALPLQGPREKQRRYLLRIPITGSYTFLVTASLSKYKLILKYRDILKSGYFMCYKGKLLRATKIPSTV